jgi:uncharacterized membrane protein
VTRLLPALASLWLLALAPAALASADGPEEVEEVEEVEQVQTVPSGAPGQARGATLDVVGKLHPLLVHFPIAWLLLLGLVDGLTFGLRRERWARAGLWLLALAVLSAVPTVVTGLLRASHVQDPKLVEELVEHRNLGLLTLGAATLALVLRLIRRNELGGPWRLAYLALIAAAVGLVIATGHHGGMLVYGENYFSF